MRSRSIAGGRNRYLRPGTAGHAVGRTVRAEIAPDGSLVGEPSTPGERVLHEMYTRGIRVDHAAPYVALAAFTVRHEERPGAEAGRLYSVFNVPNRGFELGRTEVMHGSDLYSALNSEALRAVGRACAEAVSLAPPDLPRFLLGKPGAFTHLLLAPGAYRACMGAMGWRESPGCCGPWPEADLRMDGSPPHHVAGLGLTVALAAVEDGSIFCVNSRDMGLAMGGGLVTYDYGTCDLEFRRSYSFSHGRRGAEVVLRQPL